MSHELEYLRRLGLNQLEAEVYLALLPLEPTTAYRIGKLIGRPTANVYKAVEALARRGAVMVQEGGSRLVSALPVEEFLGKTERTFLETTRQLSEDLRALQQRREVDDSVYRLESGSQVLERVRQMLEDTVQSVAVIDAFPVALEAIRPSIAVAIDRGVEVFVQAYAPVEIDGADVAITEFGEESVASWGGQQLNVVIDGREHLLALLDDSLEGVVQAIWSQSVYLSCILHAGRLCEQTIVKLLGLRGKRQFRAEAIELLESHRFFIHDVVPGHRQLSDRTGSRGDA